MPPGPSTTAPDGPVNGHYLRYIVLNVSPFKQPGAQEDNGIDFYPKLDYSPLYLLRRKGWLAFPFSKSGRMVS